MTTEKYFVTIEDEQHIADQEKRRLAANYEATKLVMDAFFADKSKPEEIQF